jgi:hypothetical protein
VTAFGQLNIFAGWIFISLGITTGSILGLWSFNGPFPTPRGHHDYADLPRRLNRLAHIACFMLPIINILYGQYIDLMPLDATTKQLGSWGMVICMVGVPTFLFLASFKPIFKYVEVVPVTAGTIALYIISWGHLKLLLNF